MNARKSKRCIVLVEDNLGDIVLFKESLAEVDESVDLMVFGSLKQIESSIFEMESACKNTAMIILLDLNLLRCSGLNVIPLFRSNFALQHVPIVIFTSSHAPKDILSSYQAGVNAYVPKPDDLIGYRTVAKSLVDFWFKHVLTASNAIFAS